MSSAVLDAGPLIHLSELNALDVLGDFDALYLPPAVWEEVAEHQPEVLTEPKLRLHKSERFFVNMGLGMLAQALSLDQGEIQALALMEMHPNAIFLIDDSAARLAAEESGYKVHGTIGLLIRAVRKGHRSPQDALNILKNIQGNSTLYIRASLLSGVIKRLEKTWRNK